MPSEPYASRGKLGSCRAQFEVKSPSAASRSPREKTSSSHRRTRALFLSGVSISSSVGSPYSVPAYTLLGREPAKEAVTLEGGSFPYGVRPIPGALRSSAEDRAREPARASVKTSGTSGVYSRLGSIKEARHERPRSGATGTGSRAQDRRGNAQGGQGGRAKDRGAGTRSLAQGERGQEEDRSGRRRAASAARHEGRLTGVHGVDAVHRVFAVHEIYGVGRLRERGERRGTTGGGGRGGHDEGHAP